MFHSELIRSINFAKACPGSNSSIHLKCPLGQLSLPMCEQGLQDNELFSKIEL